MQLDLLQDIEQSSRWKRIIPIDKGWSSDRKYCLLQDDGRQLLLRLADSDQYPSKQKEFEAMQLCWQLGIRMSEPLEFGTCGRGRFVYSLLSWLEGDPLDEVISHRPEKEQYQLGRQAGEILRRIHTIPAPSEQTPWEQRMLRKLQAHADKYRACGIQVADDHLALQFVSDHLTLLKERPQVLQHGDFHIGNMILGPDGKLGIIDFNRWDYGDPFEEFYKMMLFSRERSIPFVKGQIDGYFASAPPENFHPLLALYLADVILFSVVWAAGFGQEEVTGMIQRAEMTMRDYAGFSVCKPVWLD